MSRQFELFVNIMDGSAMPFIVTDCNYNILYNNKSAATRHPSLIRPNELRKSVDRFITEDVRKELSEGKVFAFTCVYGSFKIFNIESNQNEKFYGFIIEEYPRTDNLMIPSGVDSLISNFSHQYREPLNHIFASISVMNMKDVDEGSQNAQYLSTISQGSYQILRTTNQLTEFLRFATGNFELNKKNYDIVSYLKELCEAIDLIAVGNGVKVKFLHLKSPVILAFDSQKLTTAIVNLVSNSLKYTKENNEITISLSQNEDSIAITVSDNGLGIDSRIVDNVFEPFFTYSHDFQYPPGMGLGLTLVKNILIAHSGNVFLTSRYGKGTSVTLSLPIELNDEELSVSSTTIDYLKNRFSPVFVGLSDVCLCPES